MHVRAVAAGEPKAAIVVPFHGELFLLVDSGKGWELPGGRIELGETPKAAAVREMAEETGHSPPRLRYVCRGGRQGECAIFTCELGERPPFGELFKEPPPGLRFGRVEMLDFLGAAWRARTDYDRVSEYYDSVRGKGNTNLGKWLDLACKGLRLPEGGLVADVGCGSGRYSLGLSRMGFKVVGVDLSRGMLGRARAKAGSGAVAFVNGDAQRLPLHSASADGVLVFLALHHIPLWRDAVSECARILKPGGRCVIATTSKTRMRRHIMRFFPGAVEIDLGRFQGVGEVKSEMARAGFREVASARAAADRGSVATGEMVERYARKHLSTLTLVPENEFSQRLEVFRDRLSRRYGGEVPDETELTFVSGTIPKRQKTI